MQLVGDACVREARTSSSNGACGRQHDGAGMRLVIAAKGWRSTAPFRRLPRAGPPSFGD